MKNILCKLGIHKMLPWTRHARLSWKETRSCSNCGWIEERELNTK